MSNLYKIYGICCIFLLPFLSGCDEFSQQQTPTLSVTDITTVTGADTQLGFKFKFTLDRPSNSSISFPFEAGVSESKEDIDYELVETEINFAAGEVNQTIIVSVFNFAWDKSSQYFVVAVDKPMNVQMEKGIFSGKIQFPQSILTAIEKQEQSSTYLTAAQARFTKLDSNGNPLSASATQWRCVRDNNTGLVWEVKTDDKGLQDKNNTYSWFGDTGTQNNGKCTADINCDTATYIKAINSLEETTSEGSVSGLCGIQEWRLPTLDELETIVDNTRQHPAINTAYFPFTNYGGYWSSTESSSSSETNAWHMMFSDGRRYIHYKNFGDYVRLVYEPKQTSTFQSSYPQVFLRGTFNKWDVSPMTLVSDNLWELKVEFEGTATDRFKFDIYGNWKTNFGDFTNDGQADSDGTDIAITSGAGVYLVRFNDLSLNYSLEKVE